MTWNVRGWTSNKAIMRETFINELTPDIMCLSETHLTSEHTINLKNCTFLSHTTEKTHIKRHPRHLVE